VKCIFGSPFSASLLEELPKKGNFIKCSGVSKNSRFHFKGFFPEVPSPLRCLRNSRKKHIDRFVFKKIVSKKTFEKEYGIFGSENSAGNN
jgi:hypothetical protein